MMLAIVIYIVVPVLCLLGVHRRKSVESILTKDATLAMRGLGMMFIVFTHMAAEFICISTYFFWVSGAIGVAICFLVSGYGLHVSNKRKDNYLCGFWLPKILRLLIPFVLALILYWLRLHLEGRTMSIQTFLGSLFTITFPGTTLWYLKIQFLMYAVFFFTYRYLKGTKRRIVGVFAATAAYILIAAAAGMELFWYNTCLFFPLGLVLAEYQDHILPVLRKNRIALLAGAVFVFLYAVLYFFGRLGLDFLFDSVYMLFFCVLLLWLVQHFSGFWVLEILGKYSIEVYLLHIVIGGIFPSDEPASYILTPVVSVLLGIPVQWASGKIAGYLLNHRKQVK